MVPLPKALDERQTPDEPAVETASAPQSTYMVRSGQSLWSIAVELLGDGQRYIDLLEANPGLRANPGYIVPGQELSLPQPMR